VHDGIRLEVPEQAVQELRIAQVPLGDVDIPARDLAPRGRAGREIVEDRGQGIGSVLAVCPAPEVVVDGVHLVAARREPHGGRPTEVAVTSED
jgi:hypothetical protein